MMHTFLANNRDELIARCKAKVAQRPHRQATEEQLKNGVPLFLEQLRRTLQAEEADEGAESLKISGGSGGASLSLSEVGVSAAAHGKQLLELGFSINQVVHDYGDLCQAITELAFDRDAPFAIPEFRTLNRCLDNAIADAVTKFSEERDVSISSRQHAAEHERAAFLAHELRNHLSTAILSVAALEHGSLPMSGATGAVLKRSLASLKSLIDRSLQDVSEQHQGPASEAFSLASFIADVQSASALEARARASPFLVSSVDPVLAIRGNRSLLLGAVCNLLQNAFKFTHAHSPVTLRAYASGNRVLIDVEDCCGGLDPETADDLFKPFVQVGQDRTGLGLGLSIAKKSVEADGGTLTVRNLPGKGCVFSINLPQYELP